MEVLYPRCAGLDVHKDSVVACIRIASGGEVVTEVQTFCLVPLRRLLGRAAIRVLGCYLDDMLIDAAAFNVLKVPLIKIIDVVCVPNRDVTTSRPMNVRLGSRSHDTAPFLPFWLPRSPARQCDANSDQTKDHRRAVRIAKKTFRRVGVGCPRGTKRLSESCIAPIVAHTRPATRGTKDTMMSHRAAMTSALLLVMSLTAASAADQRVWDECNQNGDTDASIAACTQILQAQDETTSNAIAYYVRAGGYKTKGDNDHAIVDYTKAIEANAQYADAYASRAIGRFATSP